MKKVYCMYCKYLENRAGMFPDRSDYGHYKVCVYPENTIKKPQYKGNWYTPCFKRTQGEYKLSPYIINKDNNCRWFAEKE